VEKREDTRTKIWGWGGGEGIELKKKKYRKETTLCPNGHGVSEKARHGKRKRITKGQPREGGGSVGVCKKKKNKNNQTKGSHSFQGNVNRQLPKHQRY